MLSIKRFDNWSIYDGKEINKVVMGELIDKAAVVAELDRIEYETNYEPFTEEVLGKRKVCKDIKDLLDKLKISDMVSYEKKYKEALGWMKSLYGCLPGKTKEEAEKYFPELSESEDEKVERIIHSISNKISFHLHDIFTEEEFQCFDAWSNAWLEKQGKPKWTDEDEERLQSCIKKKAYRRVINDKIKTMKNEINN